VSRQLRGSVRQDWHPTGMRAELTIPTRSLQ